MPTRELHQLVLTKGGSHQSFHGSRLLVPLTSDSCLARLVSGARAVARVAAAHAGRVAVIRLAWPGGSPVPRRGSRTPLCVKLPGGVVGRPGSGDPGWPWSPARSGHPRVQWLKSSSDRMLASTTSDAPFPRQPRGW